MEISKFYLPTQVVHVWHATLQISFAQLSILYQLLNNDEQARAETFILDKSRKQFIIARATLRLLLSHYLQQEPKYIHFVNNAYGKPNLADKGKFNFNLSHSHTAIYFAIASDQEVGIDIEYLNFDIAYMNLAKRFYSAVEYNYLLSLPTDREKALAFYNAWVRKEAYVKAKGVGLLHSLREVEVSMQYPIQPLSLLQLKVSDAGKWNLYSLPTLDNYVSALVVEDLPKEIIFREWRHQEVFKF